MKTKRQKLKRSLRKGKRKSTNENKKENVQIKKNGFGGDGGS